MTTAQRLYANAKAAAENEAGGRRAFQIIGSTFRKALVAEAILGILYVQDEDVVPADRVRALMFDLRELLDEDVSLL